MFNLTLLRHGESTGNAQGLIQGQSDFPLSEKGWQQARSLANYWQAQGITFDHILSSPQQRARQTAGIVGEQLKIPVELDEIWMERDFGEYEARPFEEVVRRTPPVDFYHPYFPAGEQGESLLDLFLRACQGLQRVLRAAPGSYLVVSHGAFLNMLMHAIIGLTPQGNRGPGFRFGNTAYAELTYDPQIRRWMILSFNKQAHWTETDNLYHHKVEGLAKPNES